MSIWPSWRYRRDPETGGVQGRVFQNVSDVMNAGEGWVSSPAEVDAAKAVSAATEAPAASGEPSGEEPAAELNFSELDDEALRDIAEKAGIKVDRRWGRATLEAKLREAA